MPTSRYGRPEPFSGGLFLSRQKTAMETPQARAGRHGMRDVSSMWRPSACQKQGRARRQNRPGRLWKIFPRAWGRGGCFTFEKGETRRRRHSAARPKVSGETALFPRNDRPYGLKCEAFQTENALERKLGRGVGSARPDALYFRRMQPHGNIVALAQSSLAAASFFVVCAGESAARSHVRRSIPAACSH